MKRQLADDSKVTIILAAGSVALLVASFVITFRGINLAYAGFLAVMVFMLGFHTHESFFSKKHDTTDNTGCGTDEKKNVP